MEIVILIIVLVAVVLVAGGTTLVRRRRPVAVPPPAKPREVPKRPAARDESSDEAKGGVDVLEADLAAPEADLELAEPDLGVEIPDDAGDLLEAPVRPRFRDRLGKARATFSGYFGSIRSRGIDAETWEELEEALIRADVGVAETASLLDDLQAVAKDQGLKESSQILDALKEQVRDRLAGADRTLKLDDGHTNVWLFVGVNGVGKTTTIGKVGALQRAEGRSVLMAAGDTFRAAAAEQLEMWSERAGTDFVRGDEGADPSSVIFDGIQKANARGMDLVLADTAGRLHTKSNLMDELRKVRRVADKDPGHVTEVLLVLDAVTGQNGLVQAREFTEAVELTGVVLTKLDGSAKGGIVLAIESQLGIPVKLVGLGETIGDLIAFDPDEFVDAIFD